MTDVDGFGVRYYTVPVYQFEFYSLLSLLGYCVSFPSHTINWISVVLMTNFFASSQVVSKSHLLFSLEID